MSWSRPGLEHRDNKSSTCVRLLPCENNLFEIVVSPLVLFYPWQTALQGYFVPQGVRRASRSSGNTNPLLEFGSFPTFVRGGNNRRWSRSLEFRVLFYGRRPS